MAEKAATVGISISFWEIVMCFALSKALKSMWVLINTIQFFVYISIWKIQMPDMLRIVLKEIRRAALGEFFDDLDLMHSF